MLLPCCYSRSPRWYQILSVHKADTALNVQDPLVALHVHTCVIKVRVHSPFQMELNRRIITLSSHSPAWQSSAVRAQAMIWPTRLRTLSTPLKKWQFLSK